MPASILNLKKLNRRKKIRRISDQFTNDLYNTCTTLEWFSCLEHTAEAIFLLDSETRVMPITSQAKKIIPFKLPFVLFPTFALPSLPHAARIKTFVIQKNKKAGPLILLLTNEKIQEILLYFWFSLSEPTSADLNVARYLIRLRDPNRQLNKQLELFTEQYNSTRAEERLCCALADVLTLNDYCAYWNTKTNSARNQLSNIFYKTQTKGQSACCG